MNISELIAQLQNVEQQYGDLAVYLDMPDTKFLGTFFEQEAEYKELKDVYISSGFVALSHFAQPPSFVAS